MELLIMAYACKTSSARSIVGVIPYLPYSKQCKMRKRGCIVSKLLAKMMCKSGLSHIITMDLHQKEIQGFFDCPVDNLRASPFLLQYIQECVNIPSLPVNQQLPNFSNYRFQIIEILWLLHAIRDRPRRQPLMLNVCDSELPSSTVNRKNLRAMKLMVAIRHPHCRGNIVISKWFDEFSLTWDCLVWVHVPWTFPLAFQFIQPKRNHQLMLSETLEVALQSWWWVS